MKKLLVVFILIASVLLSGCTICNNFPYFSSSPFAASNSECLDAGESSKVFRITFIPFEKSVSNMLSYAFDYETINQVVSGE